MSNVLYVRVDPNKPRVRQQTIPANELPKKMQAHLEKRLQAEYGLPPEALYTLAAAHAIGEAAMQSGDLLRLSYAEAKDVPFSIAHGTLGTPEFEGARVRHLLDKSIQAQKNGWTALSVHVGSIGNRVHVSVTGTPPGSKTTRNVGSTELLPDSLSLVFRTRMNHSDAPQLHGNSRNTWNKYLAGVQEFVGMLRARQLAPRVGFVAPAEALHNFPVQGKGNFSANQWVNAGNRGQIPGTYAGW